MRLILTEYINSLKEDGELDQLIQDILLAYGITIISKPERGRQHGVDIYAVGPDFEDGNTEKVFLVTVKQGDLDRRNWNTEQNSIYQSLNEIKDVFIRNNLLDQHKGLPVKIVVAFNGILKTAVQQDWRGYTENNRQHEYALWTEGWLLRHFEEKLLNEQAFSNEVRSLVRKSIIHLDAPGYDLADYARLLQLFQENFREAKHKKAKLKILRELHVVVAIVLKYCDQAENLLHGVRVVEKYLLALGELLFPGEEDKEFTLCFVAAHETMLETFLRYIEKLTPVAEIRDGFSRSVLDPVVYTDIVYRHVGIFAMAGLVIFQLHDIVEAKGDEKAELRARFLAKATAIAATLIHMVNHNMIFYSPRSDEQQIEICLLFILLYRLGMKKQIRDMLAQFHEQIADGYALLQIFPEYHNNKRTIAELQIDAERRKHYDYQASNLLTILTEWCVVLEDESSYQLFRQFKEKDIAGLDLMLWFPEQDTEAAIYSRFASNDTGYVLSNIVLPESMSDYEKLLLEEFAHNCAEKEFSFIKQSIWSVGLMASRHFRTYIFPYYWRQFLKSLPPEIVSE